MQSPIRFLLSTVGGGIFATGLGLAMVSMIRVEFSPQGKADKLIYEDQSRNRRPAGAYQYAPRSGIETG